MSGHSPIDSLQRLAPVSDTQAAETFGATGREELLDGVTSLPVGRGARRRPARRRRLVLAVAVLTAAATAATAWAVLRGSAAHETTSVQCLIGSSDAVIPSTSGNPAHDCAVDYKREFGTTAPRLVAYDNGLGGVTVIPHGAEATGRLEAARLRTGRRSDPAPGLTGRLHQRPQLELPRQHGGDEPHRVEARPVRLHGLDGRRTQPRLIGNDSPHPDRDNGTRRSEGGAERVHVRHADVCWRRPRRSDDGVGHAGFRSVATGSKTVFEKLAVKLQPVTQSCESLPAAVSSVRAAASGLGLSESARGYDLNTVTDNSMRCASIYETVGGTIFITVRGPRS